MINYIHSSKPHGETHEETREDLLLDYIGGRLDRAETGRFLRHLAECAECRRQLAGILALKRAAENAVVDIPPEILKNAFRKIPTRPVAAADGACPSPERFLREQMQNTLRPIRQTFQLVRLFV